MRKRSDSRWTRRFVKFWNAFSGFRFGSTRVLARLERMFSRAWLPDSIDSCTLAERLGYPQDGLLLIVHADDFALAHAVNAALITGLETGLINSGSIMVPCP